MNKPSFNELLKKKWDEGKFVCIGLDTDYSKLPDSVKSEWKDTKPEWQPETDLSIEAAIYSFNKTIIDSTHDLVCAYKINIAFYEPSAQTWEAMLNTFYYIQRTYPDIPTILDAKVGDIGNTNEGYIKMAFDTVKADALTVHPYLGKEAMQPFLDQSDKGIIVLVKTSNPGSEEFQNLETGGKKLHEIVAENVAKKWNTNGNCAIVVGATYPEELKKVREIVGDMPILVPGIGKQGGDLEAVFKNGLDSKKQGLIISSSRSIIYAESPKEAALQLHEKIKELI
jgi:orotidine-5'-phosphate decarboxylase